MNESPRHRPAVFGPAMFMGLLLAQRVANDVSGKDFAFLFLGGLCFGVGFVNLIWFFRARRRSQPVA